MEYLKFMLFRLLAAQGVEVELDELEIKPKPLDPDEPSPDELP